MFRSVLEHICQLDILSFPRRCKLVVPVVSTRSHNQRRRVLRAILCASKNTFFWGMVQLQHSIPLLASLLSLLAVQELVRQVVVDLVLFLHELSTVHHALLLHSVCVPPVMQHKRAPVHWLARFFGILAADIPLCYRRSHCDRHRRCLAGLMRDDFTCPELAQHVTEVLVKVVRSDDVTYQYDEPRLSSRNVLFFPSYG